MKKLSLILIGIIFVTVIPVQAQDIFEELRIPVVEEVELLLDGTTPILINVTKDFHWIARIVWMLDFVSNQLLFSNFAAAGPLPIGIQVLHDGATILGNGEIKQNHQFGHTSFDLAIFSDEAGAKNRMLLSRWSFFKFLPPYGLRFINNESLQFKIQDNLTVAALAITDFSVTVEGFRIESVLEENLDLSEFFLIEIINWWGMFLYQNVFMLMAAIVVIIIIVKILKG